jgi:hypothetical protein
MAVMSEKRVRHLPVFEGESQLALFQSAILSKAAEVHDYSARTLHQW